MADDAVDNEAVDASTEAEVNAQEEDKLPQESSSQSQQAGKSSYETNDDDAANYDEFLSSAWDHAFWLAKPKVPKKLVDASQLLQKELALSSIDRSQAHYLAYFISAAQDFINFGLFGLARDELYILIAKLQLYRSIGMRERIAQIPNLASSLTWDMTDKDFEQVGQIPEEVPQKKSDTINKILGIGRRRKR